MKKLSSVGRGWGEQMKTRFIGAVILALVLSVFFGEITSLAEEREYFILCKPGAQINTRISPNKRAEIIGHLECGEKVISDGKEKNGFVHLINLHFEYTEGWVYKGLLIEEPPYIVQWKCQSISDNRVAARFYINGKRKSWIKPGKEVTVYAVGKEWCFTDRGYVQTRFLSLNYPEVSQQDR